VLALADFLKWPQFSLVGHSMSSLVTLHLAQQHAARVERAVVLCPPPPGGFGADEATLSGMRALALADDTTRTEQLRSQFGGRLSAGWMAHKLSRWRTTANPEAVAGYISMFARDGMPDRKTPIIVPILAVTGEQDAPPMRREAVVRALQPLCEQLTVTPLADCGHYPMQEMPPLTVALVERFISNRVST
jgi:pimeloyl-ACP methyl ester carboxylesterase